MLWGWKHKKHQDELTYKKKFLSSGVAKGRTTLAFAKMVSRYHQIVKKFTDDQKKKNANDKYKRESVQRHKMPGPKSSGKTCQEWSINLYISIVLFKCCATYDIYWLITQGKFVSEVETSEKVER